MGIPTDCKPVVRFNRHQRRYWVYIPVRPLYIWERDPKLAAAIANAIVSHASPLACKLNVALRKAERLADKAVALKLMGGRRGNT